jgi:hypothetical protein
MDIVLTEGRRGFGEREREMAKQSVLKNHPPDC